MHHNIYCNKKEDGACRMSSKSKYNIRSTTTSNNMSSIPTQVPQPVGASLKSSSSDPYATLGLSHDATPTQIKVAYRKLALQYHPDRQQKCVSPTPSTSSGGKQKQQQQRRETRDDCGHSFASNTTGSSSGGVGATQEEIIKETTDKFAQIAQAYSILSDPIKKREYDHLYKFGAFDNVDKNGCGTCCPTTPAPQAATNNYRYAENLSGGYYKPGYKPPKQGTAAPPPSQFGGFSASAAQTAFQQHAQAFQSMQSQDSFFDDLLYSPKASSSSTAARQQTHQQKQRQGEESSNKTDPQMSYKKKQQPGIGYSFKPLGKHLSIHVPSREEIMMNMTAAQMSQMNIPGNKGGGVGGRSHLFGTRVTFSQNKIESTSGTGLLCGANAIHSCSNDTNVTDDHQSNSEKKGGVKKTPSRKVVSTTTRIAKGKRRQVTRTAHLYPDGKKEIVIEENGIVRRRYVEEASSTPLSSPNVNSNDGENHGKDENDQKDDNETTSNDREQGSAGGLQKEESGKFTLLGLFRACYSPCASAAG